MIDSSVHVGFIHDGTLSDEQTTALDWLRDQPCAAEPLPFAELAERNVSRVQTLTASRTRRPS